MSKKQLSSPFLEETVMRLNDGWKRTINNGEICSTFFFPISGRNYRISNYLDFCCNNKISPPLVINEQVGEVEIPEDIAKKLSKAKHGVIFWPAENLLQPHMQKTLHLMIDWNNKNRKGMILLFEGFLSNLFDDNAKQYFFDIFQNVYYWPLISKEDMVQYAIHSQSKYGWNTSTIDIDDLFRLTGGHTWLLKDMLRQYQSIPNIEKISLSAEYIFKTKSIFALIPDRHKNILSKYIRKENLDKKSEEYVELKKFGFIKDDQNIAVPEFIKTLVCENDSSKIQVIKERIVINNTDVTSYFSIQETLFLKELIRKPGFHQKHELGQIIWPSNCFSDWNFDQLVKRIRKKLVKLEVAKEMIITKRGRGVKYGTEE